MAKRQKLMITLDSDAIRSVRDLAARRGTSVSKLLEALVDELIDRERHYEQAKAGSLACLEYGFPLGGAITSIRDDLHDRSL